MTNLPTKDEYIKERSQYCDITTWSEPKYICPKCQKGGMRQNLDFVLCSNPPQYMYKCNNCGYSEYGV